MSNNQRSQQNIPPELTPEPPMAVEPVVFHPSHEQVAELAYSLWDHDDRPDGNAEHYWHKAEGQLRAIGPS